MRIVKPSRIDVRNAGSVSARSPGVGDDLLVSRQHEPRWAVQYLVQRVRRDIGEPGIAVVSCCAVRKAMVVHGGGRCGCPCGGIEQRAGSFRFASASRNPYRPLSSAASTFRSGRVPRVYQDMGASIFSLLAGVRRRSLGFLVLLGISVVREVARNGDGGCNTSEDGSDPSCLPACINC